MSAWAEKIARWYRAGMWSARQVRDAVAKGRITQAECDQIIGG